MSTTNLTELRQRAEQALALTRQELNRTPNQWETADLQRLVEELHVYQTELEIQNQELQQSQVSQALILDKYRSLFDYLPLPALLVDERGFIVEGNRKAGEFLGMRSFYTGQRYAVAHFIDTSHRLKIQEVLRDTDVCSEPVIIPLISVRTRDCSFVPCDIHVLRQQRENRLDRHILLLLVDKRHEVALTTLSESLEKAKDAAESLTFEQAARLREQNRQLLDTQFAMDKVGIAIHWVDPETGQFTYVNERAAEMLGYSVEEMLTLCVPDIDPGFPPGKFTDAMEIVRFLQQIRFESTNRTKEGREFPVEVVLHYNKAEEDRPARFIGFVTDITQRKQAQIQLQRFEAIINSSEDAIIGKTLDGIVTTWNKGAEEIFGYSAEEIIGSSLNKLFPPGFNNDEENEIIKRISENETIRHFETTCLHKDGRLVYISVAISPILDEQGNIIGMSKIARDITTRKKLEEGNIQLLQALDESPDFVGIADLDGHVIYVNAGGRRLIGADIRSDFIDRRIYDFHPPWAVKKVFHEALPSVMETGRWQGELALNEEDGCTEIPVAATIFSLKDKKGKITALATIQSDLTNYKEREMELRSNEARLDFLLSSSPAIIYTCQTKPPYSATFISQNVQDLMGFNASQFIQDPNFWIDHIHPDDRKEVFTHLQEIFVHGHHQHDYRFQMPDGRYRWIHDRLRIVFSPNGTPVEMVGYWSDIDDLKKIETELINAKEAAEAANQAKSAFLATMSHEIRTPLNAIIGMAYTLGLSKLNTDQRLQLATIESASRSLLAQINDVLDLAKIEAGEIVIEAVHFNPQQIIQSVANLFRSLIQQKGLIFHVHEAWEGYPAVLEGDVHKIQQLLTNLIGNAIKFTSTGHIDLKLEIVNQNEEIVTLRFAVSDTGIGISPAVIAKIFRPFSQADASITRKHGGTGLGLFLVKQLAERMGGRVGVDSRVGKGSCFWFDLPFRTVFANNEVSLNGQADLSDLESTNSQWLPGVRVLVVDDSDMNLAVCQRLLEHQGATVTLCSSGKAALQQIISTHDGFDLVLMDVQMPEMDGYETTCRLREIHHKLPILALTAGATVNDREHALAVGMDGFLSKPIDPTQLIRSVRQHVERAQNRSLPIRERQEEILSEVNGWPVVAGLDTDAVRCRLAGDKTLFLKLLDDFFERSVELLGQAGQAVTIGQPKAAAAALHNFRGQAGNIGATTLAAEAGRLERGAQQGQLTAEQLDLCLSQLKSFTQTMTRWRQTQLPLIAAVQNDAPPLDTDTLAVFKKNLARQNAAALYTFESHAANLRTMLGPTVYQEFDAAMNRIDFANALRLLNESI